MHRLLALPLLLLAAVAAAADLQVYPLKHRPAAELIPLIEPMVDGRISGRGDRLFVRAEKAEQAVVEALIEELDTPPQRLRISVRQVARGEDERAGTAASGRIGTDEDGEVRGEARARIHGTRELDREDTVQQVQVMEGGWSRIEVGQAVPVGYRRASGDGVETGVEYVRATRGFRVRARLANGEALVEVRPFGIRESDEGGGRFELRNLVTTLRGPLGTWLELGGQHTSVGGHEEGTVRSTRELSEQNYRTLIRVERLSGE